MKSVGYYILSILLFSLVIDSLAQDTVNVTITKYFGDYVLYEGDTIYADNQVRVIVGDATINGVLLGSVNVYAGDATIGPTGKVYGQLTCLAGTIRKDPSALVEGKLVEANLRGISVQTTTRTPEQKKYKKEYRFPSINKEQEHKELIYNRQEGLYLETRIDQTLAKVARLNLFIGYGFGMKQWRGGLRLELPLWKVNPLTPYVEIYSRTVNDDIWRYGTYENTMAFFFAKEDYHDRYKAEGYRFGFKQELGELLFLNGEFISQFEDSMKIVRRWSLFRNEKSVRPVPFTTNVGKNIGYRARIRINLGKNGFSFPGIFQLTTDFEYSPKDAGGDFNYQKIIILGKYAFGSEEAFQLRSMVRIGSSARSLPDQRTFFLGGMGSLRGFSYKSFSGNRMILGTQEFALHLGNGRFWLVPFLDAGYTWNADSPPALDSDFSSLTWSDLHINIGIGIESRKSSKNGFRLDFARSVESRNTPWIATLHWKKSF
jgi:hypothetical protein